MADDVVRSATWRSWSWWSEWWRTDDTRERSLHGLDDDTEQLAHRIFDCVIDHIRMSPPPLDAPGGPAELAAATGETVTDDGLGWERALALFSKVLAPACISSDHPRYLGFAPTARTEAATLFDLVVSASLIFGDWWIEGAGAIHGRDALTSVSRVRAGSSVVGVTNLFAAAGLEASVAMRLAERPRQ